jgi:spoIIIJ-associated protein
MTKDKKVDSLSLTKGLAEELLKELGSKAQVEVSEDKDNEAVVVNIKTDDETGLLIGHHGETLLSIQGALGLMLRQKIGEWIRIVVNVGDWREKQEEHLRVLAQEAAERAKETGEPQPIYNLSPAQRRIIHIELGGDDKITTESTGEGEERYLVINPKKS